MLARQLQQFSCIKSLHGKIEKNSETVACRQAAPLTGSWNASQFLFLHHFYRVPCQCQRIAAHNLWPPYGVAHNALDAYVWIGGFVVAHDYPHFCSSVAAFGIRESQHACAFFRALTWFNDKASSELLVFSSGYSVRVLCKLLHNKITRKEAFYSAPHTGEALDTARHCIFL